MNNKSSLTKRKSFGLGPPLPITRPSIPTKDVMAHWDVIIPASLFTASAICYVDPFLAPSIILAILAMATINVSPVMAYFTKPVTEGLTDTVTDALNTITDENYSEKRERLFSSVADLISKTVQSPALTNSLKESVLSCLLDDDLHDATLITLQTALIKASENDIFQATVMDVVKQAFTGALNDENFVRDLMTSIVGAIVTASKEEELNQSVLDVVTKGVSQALANENFVAELRGAIKDTLADGDIYKAGARGMVSAAFGFGHGNAMKKSLSNPKMITESKSYNG